MNYKISDQIDQLSAAMALVQSKIIMPKKSKQVKMVLKNGQRKEYAYAPLDDIYKSILQVAPQNGIYFSQDTVTEGDDIYVKTAIFHTSGQYKITVHKCRLFDKSYNDVVTRASIQEEGSAITYTKRYAITGAFGIAADEDDDGELANDYQASNTSTAQKKQSTGEPRSFKDVLQAKPEQKKQDSMYLTQDEVLKLYSDARSRGISDEQTKTIIIKYAGEIKSSAEITRYSLSAISSEIGKVSKNGN